jgi:hypothetical protein
MLIITLGTGFLVCIGITAVVEMGELITNRISQTLIYCLCSIIVLNMHATTEDKCDDTKDSFYEDLQHVFNQFLNFYINILLDFNAEVEIRYSQTNNHVAIKAYTNLTMMMGLSNKLW